MMGLSIKMIHTWKVRKKGMKEVIQLIINKLKSTDDCARIGRSLTPDDIRELTNTRKTLITSVEKWQEEEAWDIAMIMATKAQFCREAIEHSTHYNIQRR